MTLELNKMASFLFDPEGGKLMAATRNAESESSLNREFLSKAAKIGVEPRVSSAAMPTFQR